MWEKSLACLRYLQIRPVWDSQSSRSSEPVCLCPCRVQDQTHLALSYRLKLLKEGGLVDSRRERSFQIYDFTELGSLLLKYIEKQFEKA